MSTKTPADKSALEAAKAVMKRMLETPPTPHEATDDHKHAKRRKRAGKRA